MEIKYDVLGRYGEFGTARTILDENEITWYCANDICDILLYDETSRRKILSRYCRNVIQFDVTCQNVTSDTHARKTQRMNFITRDDIFRLLDHSRMPKAEEFRQWLFGNVIPSIEYTGAYIDNEAKDDIKDKSVEELIALQEEFENYKAATEKEIKEKTRYINLANTQLSAGQIEDINMAVDAIDMLELKDLQIRQNSECIANLNSQLNAAHRTINLLLEFNSSFNHPNLIKPTSKPLIRFMDKNNNY